MKANPEIYAEVKTALDGWAESYKRRDIGRMLSHIAPDADVLMYGTGADEKRIGREAVGAQAQRDWSQTDASAFILDQPMISAAGSVAWTAADAVFHVEMGGQEMAFPARFTGVFEKRDGKWLVVQAHFSLPAAQDEGESVPHN